MANLAELNRLHSSALAAIFAGPPDEVAQLLRLAAEGRPAEVQFRFGHTLDKTQAAL